MVLRDCVLAPQEWQEELPFGFRFVEARKGEGADWFVGEGKFASDTGDGRLWLGVIIG